MLKVLSACLPLMALATSVPGPARLLAAEYRDGSHDFDFLIGNWRAHVRRLPDRLVGSNAWIAFDGISNHVKLLDSNANFEEFDVQSRDGKRIKAQTLRLYNPESRQWSIYGIDLDKGTLDLPPVVGEFTGVQGGITLSERSILGMFPHLRD